MILASVDISQGSVLFYIFKSALWMKASQRPYLRMEQPNIADTIDDNHKTVPEWHHQDEIKPVINVTSSFK